MYDWVRGIAHLVIIKKAQLYRNKLMEVCIVLVDPYLEKHYSN